jgi:adenine C2-methylase RlmN of 23S rRNA A2503 and tRNA A37
LLEQTLAQRGEPAFRAGQVWEWAARGVRGYEAMTNVPVAVRAELAARVPFSSLVVEHTARSRDGTVKVLFRTHDGLPVEAVLMRYRGSSRAAIEAFRAALERAGLEATIRLTRGSDIAAACGQLAAVSSTA